jgi:hypothetical protein
VSEDLERALDESAYGRRTFLRRMVMGSAFAVPVVSSFSMAGIQAVSAQADQRNGLFGNPNTTECYIGGANTTSYMCGPNGNGGIFGFFEELFYLFTHPHRPF